MANRDSLRRQGEPERTPCPIHGFGPDSSAMPLQDYPANREPQARTGALRAMQAHEWPEDAVQIGRFNPRAVVANRKKPVFRPSFNSDSNLRRDLTAVPQGIVQEVFKDLHQTVRDSRDARQFV